MRTMARGYGAKESGLSARQATVERVRREVKDILFGGDVAQKITNVLNAEKGFKEVYEKPARNLVQSIKQNATVALEANGPEEYINPDNSPEGLRVGDVWEDDATVPVAVINGMVVGISVPVISEYLEGGSADDSGNFRDARISRDVNFSKMEVVVYPARGNMSNLRKFDKDGNEIK